MHAKRDANHLVRRSDGLAGTQPIGYMLAHKHESPGENPDTASPPRT